MTDTCSCGEPLRDNATIGDRCLWRLERDLGDVTAISGELDTTLSRQDRVTRSGGKRGPEEGDNLPMTAAETPSPFDLRASDALDLLRTVLSGWVRVLATSFEAEGYDAVRARLDEEWPDDNLPSMSAWLLCRMERIRHHEAGQEIASEVKDAMSQARKVIDRDEDRIYAGPCGSNDGECTEQLYVRMGAESTVCPRCGAESSTSERRTWLLEAVQDAEVGALDLSRALQFLGQPLSTRTILRWAEKGRLQRRGTVGRHAVYRVGDAILLLNEDMARVAGVA